MSAEKCDFIDECPMFKCFRSSAKKVYREVFCEGDFSNCQRRKLRLAGEPVPQNLLPHGGLLKPDGSVPDYSN